MPSHDRLREVRYDVGDLVKRYNMLDSDKEATSCVYLILAVNIDEEGWVWYYCYSFGSGTYREFLMDDNSSRKYVKLA